MTPWPPGASLSSESSRDRGTGLSLSARDETPAASSSERRLIWISRPALARALSLETRRPPPGEVGRELGRVEPLFLFRGQKWKVWVLFLSIVLIGDGPTWKDVLRLKLTELCATEGGATEGAREAARELAPSKFLAGMDPGICPCGTSLSNASRSGRAITSGDGAICSATASAGTSPPTSGEGGSASSSSSPCETASKSGWERVSACDPAKACCEAADAGGPALEESMSRGLGTPVIASGSEVCWTRNVTGASTCCSLVFLCAASHTLTIEAAASSHASEEMKKKALGRGRLTNLTLSLVSSSGSSWMYSTSTVGYERWL
eukprot:scaffold220405_cov41-Tisochrysis_lutea.AAC.1